MESLFRGLFDSELTTVISVTDFMLCLGLSLVLGLIMAVSYMYRTRYTKSFFVTLVLLPAVVCVVIMLVNGSGRTLPTLCRKCKEAGNKLISLGVCKACGKEITQKAYLVDKWNIEEQTLHKECRDIVYTYAYCKECGNRFSITFGEKESFDRKGYELPKRCKGCRG